MQMSQQNRFLGSGGEGEGVSEKAAEWRRYRDEGSGRRKEESEGSELGAGPVARASSFESQTQIRCGNAAQANSVKSQDLEKEGWR